VQQTLQKDYHCKSVPAQSQIWHAIWQSCLKWRTISHMWSIFCFTWVKYASPFFWHMVCQIRLTWSQQRIIVKHTVYYTTCVKCDFVPVPDLQCTCIIIQSMQIWSTFVLLSETFHPIPLCWSGPDPTLINRIWILLKLNFVSNFYKGTFVWIPMSKSPHYKPKNRIYFMLSILFLHQKCWAVLSRNISRPNILIMIQPNRSWS
jgi:hypothetical protein